ncbi:serine-rich adhesin for platelets-like [Hetaerina americana]|uniref:serine-rich adhesin for platelets-like n=1 Tax=Hetaerina americana TaxID=62018 RepID=UPI003A7F60EE
MPNSSTNIAKKRPTQNRNCSPVPKSGFVQESRNDTASGGSATVQREAQEGFQRGIKNPKLNLNRSLTKSSVESDKRHPMRRDSLDVPSNYRRSKGVSPSSELRCSSFPKVDDSRTAKVPSFAKKSAVESNRCLGGRTVDLGDDSSSDSDGGSLVEPPMLSVSSSEEDMMTDDSLSIGDYVCPVIGCRKRFGQLKGLLIHSKRVKHSNDEFMRLLWSNANMREELKKCRSMKGKETFDDHPSDDGRVGNDLKTLVVPDEVGFAVSGGKDDSSKVQISSFSHEHGDSIWKCNIDGCQLEYGSKRSLGIHRAYKHNPGFVIRRKGLGKKLSAIKVSKDKEVHIRQCPHCLKKFKSKGVYRRHLEKNHRIAIDTSGLDTSGKSSDRRDDSLEDVPLKNTGTHPNGIEKPKTMPRIRECSVVLHDIMKSNNAPGIPLRNTASNIFIVPPETVNVNKNSGEGIMKYFPVVSTLNPISISDNVTQKDKKSSPSDKFHSGKISRLSLASGNQEKLSSIIAARQETQVPISTLFANAIKNGTSHVSEEAVPKISSKVSGSPISDRENSLVFKELTVPLCKLLLSPDKLSANMKKSPGKKPVGKSSPSKVQDSLKDHGISKPCSKFKCDVCLEVFLSKSNLCSHMRLKHGCNLSHVCPICKRSYVSRAKFKIHMKYHDWKLKCKSGKKNDVNSDLSTALGHAKPGVLPNRTSHPNGDQQNDGLERSSLLESSLCPGSPDGKGTGDKGNRSSHEQGTSGTATDVSEESQPPKTTKETEISKLLKEILQNSTTTSESASTSSTVSITSAQESSDQIPVDTIRNVIVNASVAQLQSIPDSSETVKTQSVLPNDESQATVPETGAVSSSSASTKLKYVTSESPTGQSNDESASPKCSSVNTEVIDVLVTRADSSITAKESEEGTSEDNSTKRNVDLSVSPKSCGATDMAISPRNSEACISVQERIKDVPAVKQSTVDDQSGSRTSKLVQEAEINPGSSSNSVIVNESVRLEPNASEISSADEIKVLEAENTSPSADGIPETGVDIVQHSTRTDTSTIHTVPHLGYVEHNSRGVSKSEDLKTKLADLNFRPGSEESGPDVRCNRLGDGLEVQEPGKSDTEVGEAKVCVPVTHSVPLGILEEDSLVGAKRDTVSVSERSIEATGVPAELLMTTEDVGLLSHPKTAAASCKDESREHVEHKADRTSSEGNVDLETSYEKVTGTSCLVLDHSTTSSSPVSGGSKGELKEDNRRVEGTRITMSNIAVKANAAEEPLSKDTGMAIGGQTDQQEQTIGSVMGPQVKPSDVVAGFGSEVKDGSSVRSDLIDKGKFVRDMDLRLNQSGGQAGEEILSSAGRDS